MPAVALLAAAAAVVPLPGAPAALARFEGAAAPAQPFAAAPVPRHPFMAPNGRSNIHVDAFQSDTNTALGPLGRGGVRTRSASEAAHECASIAFDRRGRLVTVCVGLSEPRLQLLDPHSLATLAQLDLPPRPSGPDALTNFSGGGYFYLDHRDRAVVPTTTRHVRIIAVRGRRLVPVADRDLTRAVGAGDAILSALPDWDGRLWFASRRGVVGWVGRRGGRPHARRLHEAIGNSFAVGPDGGVYVVTDAALYRLVAAPRGRVRIAWRAAYPNTGERKPGQTEAGSGTTPTLMGHRLVAITDNADPMAVLVLDRRTGRRVCRVPVFARGASATDQSLVATERTLVVENNFGYAGPAAVAGGRSTTPGLTRVDVTPHGCHTVWRSREIAPSAVAKLSLGGGLVYTYAKPPRADGLDGWYLTAIDVRTGRTAFRVLGGAGALFNNNFAPVTLGPDGTAYLGVLGGIVSWRDRRPAPRFTG
jgi:hypothetical protein